MKTNLSAGLLCACGFVLFAHARLVDNTQDTKRTATIEAKQRARLAYLSLCAQAKKDAEQLKDKVLVTSTHEQLVRPDKIDAIAQTAHEVEIYLKGYAKGYLDGVKKGK